MSGVTLRKIEEGSIRKSCLCLGTLTLPRVTTTCQLSHGRFLTASPSLVYPLDVTPMAVYSLTSSVSKCLTQPSSKYKYNENKSRTSAGGDLFVWIVTPFDLISCTAKYLGLKSPVAYQLRKVAKARALKYGMNFATGGTGVFDTIHPGPNMTTQIDFFQELIEMKAASISSGIDSSVALVVLSGNDYSTYLARNGSINVSVFIHEYNRTTDHIYVSQASCFWDHLMKYHLLFSGITYPHKPGGESTRCKYKEDPRSGSQKGGGFQSAGTGMPSYCYSQFSIPAMQLDI